MINLDAGRNGLAVRFMQMRAQSVLAMCVTRYPSTRYSPFEVGRRFAVEEGKREERGLGSELSAGCFFQFNSRFSTFLTPPHNMQ